MRADAGAAIGKIVTCPLEDVDVPADRAQLVSGQQASERAADDDRAPLADFLHLACPSADAPAFEASATGQMTPRYARQSEQKQWEVSREDGPSAHTRSCRAGFPGRG